MMELEILNGFTLKTPFPDENGRLPTSAGVFVIVRSPDADDCEFVYCAQSTNISDAAKEAAKEQKYQDPDDKFIRAITYLVKEEESLEERIKIFQELNKICTNKNNK